MPTLRYPKYDDGEPTEGDTLACTFHAFTKTWYHELLAAWVQDDCRIVALVGRGEAPRLVGVFMGVPVLWLQSQVRVSELEGY